MSKFPKKLYLKREKDGDSSYLVSHESPDTAIEVGEKVQLGIYKLVATTVAESYVQTSKTKLVK